MTEAIHPPLPTRAAARPRSRFADLAPPRWFPLTAAVTGALTATVTVGHRPGIGLTLAILAAFGVTFAVTGVDRGDRPLAALAALLAMMPALRDADWLVALDLLTVTALFALVAVGGREWRSLAVAAVSVPLRALPAPAFLARGLPAGRDLGPALRGTALATALVVVFGALFSSADAAFGQLTGGLLPDTSLLPAQVVVFAVVTVALGALVLARRVPVAIDVPSPRPRRTAEWLVPLVAVDALFAAFVAVQAAVLFGGQDHVLRTSGLSYAEYARSGFFQLITVTALTFGVVAGAVRWAPRSRLPRALVGVLCVLDGVVLVSAIRRLGLYEQEFGLSVARVLAYTVAFWLGAVLLLVLAAGLTGRAAWLPRAVIGTGAAALLLLNVADPEARIARSLVHRHERTGDLDAAYLGGLSADAVPEIRRLPQPWRDCVLAFQSVPHDSWAGANRSRAQARHLLEDRPLAEPYGFQGC